MGSDRQNDVIRHPLIALDCSVAVDNEMFQLVNRSRVFFALQRNVERVLNCPPHESGQTRLFDGRVFERHIAPRSVGALARLIGSIVGKHRSVSPRAKRTGKYAVGSRGILFDEVEPKLVASGEAQHSERGAPQPEGIAGSRRLPAGDPQARERIDLVGQRHGNRHRRRRHRIGGPLRRIVLLDRRGHLGRQPLGLGVAAADVPLQLGKLADHQGAQVGLREPCRLFGEVRVGPHRRGDLTRQRRDALHPLPLAAELFVEGHRLQLLCMLGQR